MAWYLGTLYLGARIGVFLQYLNKIGGQNGGMVFGGTRYVGFFIVLYLMHDQKLFVQIK